MKLLVDVARLEADGVVTPAQAAAIRRVAAAETSLLAINLLSMIGIAAIVGGVVALAPGIAAAAVIGVVLVAGGLLLRRFRAADFGFLGSALVLIGALLHCGAVLMDWEGSTAAFAYATVVILGLGILIRHGFLVALSVFSIAALLGSSTGYWHAAYALWVEEPTFTIVAFGLLALAAFVLSRLVPLRYQRLARLFALLSVVWVNFGFWVGSLWGDRPGSSWFGPDAIYGSGSGGDREAALRRWYEQALQIPSGVFAVAWAVGLVGLGAWAGWRGQRAAVNAVATFGAIHFYTQWFERLDASPATVIAGGVIAVAIAFLLWRYNQMMKRGR